MIAATLRKIVKRAYYWFELNGPVDPHKRAEWLRSKGLSIGTGTVIYADVVIGRSHGGYDPVVIGADSVLTGCTILGHDASTNRELGIKTSLRKKTVIGDRCFIGHRAILMMGVELGNDCIVGAGAVVTKSFEPDSIIAGNPARRIGSKSELVRKRKAELGIE